MTELSAPCPTPEQLKSLIEGTLPESEQAQVQTHVDDCAICQQTLESLVAGTESWDSALGQLRDEKTVSHDAVLSEAIQRMKADEFGESCNPAAASATSLSFLTPSDQPGSIGRLGTYEVTEVIGQGGMGVVLKAFDPALHRVVAVKVLAPYLAHNPQARKRFVREAQAIAAVSHDHVITIHAIDESAEQPKIVMQYVAGRSLQQKIDLEGSLELKEILRIGMQTAAGLAAAHAQGLVHRDVKPSNILLENGVQRVKLTDFGLARAVDDASLTQSGAIAGTPQYMAPEQANGDGVDFRADLFSLGSVLYAMCVGHSPFRASTTMGVLKRVCHDPPRPIQELNPDIPEWLCTIVMKLLEKKPEDRFPTAKSVTELLEKWLAHVQQPMIVPKPPAVQNAAPNPAISCGETTTPASSTSRSWIDPEFARTIFFQQISWRSFLFFLLTGSAICMAFVSRSGVHPNEFIEVMLASFGFGLFFSFVGLLLFSLGRFILANVIGIFAPRKVDATTENSSGPSKTSAWLSPESTAMLAAIGAIMLTVHPIFAAIVAIIVWRAMTWRFANLESTTTSEDSNQKEAEQNRSNAYAPSSRSDRWRKETRGLQIFLKKFLALWLGLLIIIWRFIKRCVDRCMQLIAASAKWLLNSAETERNRLLLSIGWCLVGGIDLVSLPLVVSIHGSLILACAWIFLGILSLIVSHCVYASQNMIMIRIGSFIGLFPLSFGAIFRIPLSIVTLFWSNLASTKESLGTVPFAETHLGKLWNGSISLFRRMTATTAWMIAWSLGWLTALTAVYWLYLVPYGPATYNIRDKCRVTLRGPNNAQFDLMVLGTGVTEGMGPPVQSLHRTSVSIGCKDHQSHEALVVKLGTPLINETTKAELTFHDIEQQFASHFDNQMYPEHATSLFQSIRRLNVEETGIKRLLEPKDRPLESKDQLLSRESELIKRINRFTSRLGTPTSIPWAGFTRIESMLDRSLFAVQPAGDSWFECRPSPVVLTIGLASAFLIWLIGCIRIIRRRHFQRAIAQPVAVLVS